MNEQELNEFGLPKFKRKTVEINEFGLPKFKRNQPSQPSSPQVGPAAMAPVSPEQIKQGKGVDYLLINPTSDVDIQSDLPKYKKEISDLYNQDLNKFGIVQAKLRDTKRKEELLDQQETYQIKVANRKLQDYSDQRVRELQATAKTEDEYKIGIASINQEVENLRNKLVKETEFKTKDLRETYRQAFEDKIHKSVLGMSDEERRAFESTYKPDVPFSQERWSIGTSTLAKRFGEGIASGLLDMLPGGVAELLKPSADYDLKLARDKYQVSSGLTAIEFEQAAPSFKERAARERILEVGRDQYLKEKEEYAKKQAATAEALTKYQELQSAERLGRTINAPQSWEEAKAKGAQGIAEYAFSGAGQSLGLTSPAIVAGALTGGSALFGTIAGAATIAPVEMQQASEEGMQLLMQKYPNLTREQIFEKNLDVDLKDEALKLGIQNALLEQAGNLFLFGKLIPKNQVSKLLETAVNYVTSNAFVSGGLKITANSLGEAFTEWLQRKNQRIASLQGANPNMSLVEATKLALAEDDTEDFMAGLVSAVPITVTAQILSPAEKKENRIETAINTVTDTGDININQLIDNEAKITAPVGDLGVKQPVYDQKEQIGVPSAEQQGAAPIQEGAQPEGGRAQVETGGVLQVSPETPGAQAELDAKKADIERRRQEELEKRIPKKSEIWKDDEGRYYRVDYTNDNKIRLVVVDEKSEQVGGIIGEYSADVPITNFINNGEKVSDTELKGKQQFIDKINAKYDAELAALTSQVTPEVTPPVAPAQFDVKEQDVLKPRTLSKDLTLFHYSSDPELTREKIDPLRVGVSQMKKKYAGKPEGERPAGFYATLSPNSFYGRLVEAEGVPVPATGAKTPYAISLSNVNFYDITDEFSPSDRIPQARLKELKDQGVDVVLGRGMVGEPEFIILNQDKITEVKKVDETAKQELVQKYGKTRPKYTTEDISVLKSQVKPTEQVTPVTTEPTTVTPTFDVAKVASPENLTAIETNSKAEVDRVVALPTTEKDGATFNLDGTTYTGGGVVVPVTSVNLTKAEMTPQRIAQFVKDNAGKIGADNVKVGIYKFPNQDNYSVDLNIVIPQEFQQQGLDFARAAGQESVYDLATDTNIKTGATGMTPATFTDEQFQQIASALAQGKVPQITPTTLEVQTTEATPTVTTERQQAEQELEAALGIIPVNERNESEIQDAVDAVQSSLKSMGVSIVSVPTIEEYNKVAEKEGAETATEGMFVSDKGVIYINTELIVKGITGKRVIWHEAAHPILNIIQNTDKTLYNKVVSGLKKAAEQNKDLQEVSEWADSYGDDATRDNEFLTEVIARIADGSLDISNLNTGLKQSLIDLINKIAKALGFGQVISDTDLAAFKGLVTQISEVLVKGKDAAEIVGKENLDQYGSSLVGPVQLKKVEVFGEKLLKRTGDFPLSFVKQKDIIDIKKLLKDISDKNQKVWFWAADQLGRGMYYDKVIGSSHYLDAGPSFALDPENRKNKRIWATGKSENWVNERIKNSDYIFIISGSPLKSKLFNKRVAEITFNRIKSVANTENAWDVFKKDVLETSKISALNELLNKYNSFEELIDSPDRKEFLILIDAQKEKKATPLKATLEKYNAFVDYNEIRDGFYRENDFQLNDIMLVLKPNAFGGKSAHSTYENDILGEVVGIPDTKINAFDIMPDEFKAKYSTEISRTEQSQAVAPYGAGIRKIQYSRSQKANPINKVDGDLTTGTPYEKHMTSDNKDNFIFFHTTDADYKDIKPGLDSRKFYSTRTSREEKALQYGVASYYTKPTDSEAMVLGDKYFVRVPISKVYPMNTDPNGYEAKAEQNIPKNEPFRYEKVRKEMARLAKDDGYQMAVAYWGLDEKKGSVRRGMLALRGDALVPLKPVPFTGAEDFKVGPQYSKRKLSPKNKLSVTRALVKVGEDMIKTGEATVANVIEKLRNFTKGKYAVDISEIENDILSSITAREAIRSQEFDVNNSIDEFTDEQGQIDEEESFGSTELVDKMASYLTGKVINASQVKRFVTEWNKQNPENEVNSTEVWNKIDGKPVDEKVIKTSLTKILQEKERTKKVAGKESVKQFKDIVEYVRDAVKETKLTWAQSKAILTKLKGITYLTPERVAKAKEFVDKVVADAKVAQKFHYAAKLKKKLKKAPVKAAAPVKTMGRQLASVDVTMDNIDEFIIHALAIVNSFARPDMDNYAGVKLADIEVFVQNERRIEENEMTAALMRAASENELSNKDLETADAYNNPTDKVTTVDEIVDQELDLTEEKKKLTRERLVAIATDMREILRALPTIPGMAKEKAILERFNPSVYPLDSIVQYIKIVNNAILNNNLAGSGRLLAAIEAQTGVNSAISEVKKARQSTASLGWIGRRYTEVKSNVAAALDKLLGGKDASFEFSKYTGWNKYLEAYSQFTQEKNRISKQLDQRIEAINKKYKTDVVSEKNQLLRRVLSEYAKYVNDPTASIEKVTRNIEGDIKELLSNNTTETTELANRLYALLNDMRQKGAINYNVKAATDPITGAAKFEGFEFSDGDITGSSQTVQNYFEKNHPAVYELWDFWQKIYDSSNIFKRASAVNEKFYNELMQEYKYYSPTVFRKLGEGITSEEAYPVNTLRPSQSNRFKEATRNRKAGYTYSYIQSMSDDTNALWEVLHDIYTTEAQFKYAEAIVRPELIDPVNGLFSGEKRDFIIQDYKRRTNIDKKSIREKLNEAQVMIDLIGRISKNWSHTSRLISLKQPIVQWATAAASLSVMLGKRSNLLFQPIPDSFNDVIKLTPAALRAAEESFLNLNNVFNVSDNQLQGLMGKAFKGLAKTEKLSKDVSAWILKWDIGVFDANIYKRGWVAMYTDSLMNQGVTDVNLETENQFQDDPRRERARAIATQEMTKIMGATEQVSKSQIMRLRGVSSAVIGFIFPFASFQFNFKDRIVTAAYKINSAEGKREMAAALTEAFVFSVVSEVWARYIVDSIATLFAEKILGVDLGEDEEGEEETILGITRKTVSNFITRFYLDINPLAVSITENGMLYIANWLEWLQSDTLLDFSDWRESKEEKIPIIRKTLYDHSGGYPGIVLDDIINSSVAARNLYNAYKDEGIYVIRNKDFPETELYMDPYLREMAEKNAIMQSLGLVFGNDAKSAWRKAKRKAERIKKEQQSD